MQNIPFRYLFMITIHFQRCTSGHHMHRWSFQPRLRARGVHSADFMLAKVLCCLKIITRKFLSLKFMDIGCVISEFFNQVQILYCVEAISIFFKEIQAATRDSARNRDVVVTGKYLLTCIQLSYCCITISHIV